MCRASQALQLGCLPDSGSSLLSNGWGMELHSHVMGLFVAPAASFGLLCEGYCCSGIFPTPRLPSFKTDSTQSPHFYSAKYSRPMGFGVWGLGFGVWGL